MATEIIQQKICSKCGKRNPITEFYKLRAGGTKPRATCITCTKQLQPSDPVKARARYVRQRDASGKHGRPERVQCVCNTCEKTFSIPPAWARRGTGKYCSCKCSDEFKKSLLGTRFWSKVDKRGPDECWLWTAGRDHNNYGAFSMVVNTAKRTLGSHVVAFTLAFGQVPKGLIVRHRCDNPPCVNPAHLESGTYADNAQDRESRGRGNKARGMQRSDKLTDDMVRDIRKRYGRRVITQQRLADEHGVTIGNISCIVRGETWKHIL